MKYILYFLLIFLLSSCGVKYKTIPYFTDLSSEPVSIKDIGNSKQLIVQKGDAFLLEVSSLNNMASAVFNSGNKPTNITTSNQPALPAGSYTVGTDGDLRIPLAGSVKIEGLTLVEARKEIEKHLEPYLKEPVVNLTLINFRISVLGDVVKPGSYLVDHENLSVLEAIGLAGDLTITAQRNNVLLIREKAGKREYIRLNLQQKNLFDSPYYYLKSGDMLYIQPGEAKYDSIDTKYRNAGLLLSLISVGVLIFGQLNR